MVFFIEQDRFAEFVRNPLKAITVAQAKRSALVPVQDITRAILILRGQRVLLDAELADLYGVPTKALNQAVKRNAERFRGDFMFRLTRTETEALNRPQWLDDAKRHA